MLGKELSKEQVEALKAAVPPVIPGEPERELVQYDLPNYGEVVVLLPQAPEYRAFRQQVANNQQTAVQIVEGFVRKCVVHPSREEVAHLFTRRPLLVDELFDKIKGDLGASEQITSKKL